MSDGADDSCTLLVDVVTVSARATQSMYCYTVELRSVCRTVQVGRAKVLP